jgi:hypothetical protein
MAASEAKEPHVPGILGGDLPEKERLAYEEAHDADIPSNAGVVTEQDPLRKETSADSEKQEARDHSTNSSENGDRDLEKGPPVEAVAEEPKEDEPRDPNIVDWEGPDDPEKPMNWSVAKKWSNIAILSFLTLLTPLASSMFAPGVPDVIEEFHTQKYGL